MGKHSGDRDAVQPCRTLPRLGRASKALQELTSMVRLQAAVMSYADVFLMMTVLFISLAALGILMKRPQAPAGSGGGTLTCRLKWQATHLGMGRQGSAGWCNIHPADRSNRSQKSARTSRDYPG